MPFSLVLPVSKKKNGSKKYYIYLYIYICKGEKVKQKKYLNFWDLFALILWPKSYNRQNFSSYLFHKQSRQY